VPSDSRAGWKAFHRLGILEINAGYPAEMRQAVKTENVNDDSPLTILGDPRNPPPPKKQSDVGVVVNLPPINRDRVARDADSDVGKYFK
jgi:hypothetical protein